MGVVGYETGRNHADNVDNRIGDLRAKKEEVPEHSPLVQTVERQFRYANYVIEWNSEIARGPGNANCRS